MVQVLGTTRYHLCDLNEACAAKFGKRPEDFIGKRWIEYLPTGEQKYIMIKASGRVEDLRMKRIIIVFFTLSFITGDKAVAVIINVPGEQPTIQAAIDAAVDGDEIVVAPGTYVGTVLYNGKALNIHSSGGLDVTTIQGSINISDIVGPTTVLEGFTIIGSSHLQITNCLLGPLVTDCNFTALGAGAGAMSVIDCAFGPVVSNCAFTGGDRTSGGAIHIFFSNAIIQDCQFVENIAHNEGSAVYAIGPGSTGVFTEVSRSVFIDNSGTPSNTIAALHGDYSTVTECTFDGNSVGFRNARSDGGVDVIDCIFRNNGAGSMGGGTFTRGGFFDNGPNGGLTGGFVTSITDFCGNAPYDFAGGQMTFAVCGPCPDLDGDGLVGVPDLLQLLAAWGPCP